jgi:hypothetical protein
LFFLYAIAADIVWLFSLLAAGLSSERSGSLSQKTWATEVAQPHRTEEIAVWD